MSERVAEFNPIPPGSDAATREPSASVASNAREFAKNNVRTGKYAVVGIAAMAVSFVVFNLMYWYTRTLVPSSLAAFFVSATFGFLCQRSWTFADKRGKSAMRQYTETIMTNCVGTLFGTLITALLMTAYSQVENPRAGSFFDILTSLVTKRTTGFPIIVVDIAAYSTAAVVTIWNYLSLTRWVYKH